MLLQFYSICIILLLCEAATKIGLGNGRPSEDPSSLKTEVLKFKTSECGGSSSEEPMNNKKKHKNRQNDDDDDDDDSEEDKRNRRKNRGRNRGRGYREEYLVYGRSYEDMNRQFGMGRRDDYNNRQDNPFQQSWDDPYNNRNRNQYSPYYGNNEDEFFPQINNRRNNNRDRDRDMFNQRPTTYNNDHNNRDRYNYHEEDRYNNNNRDDRHSNRRNHNKNNNWEDDDDNDDDDYNNNNNNKKGGHRRQNNRNQSKRNKKRKNKDDNSDGECVSQCVFNNMEIMEDDGIPSEAGMIKWAQDKIKNEKLKQSAVKEIRKCFGTLASSDGENSCNFSKSLANCLKLGLDEEKD